MAFLRLVKRAFSEKPWKTHFPHQPIYPAPTESNDPFILQILDKTHKRSRQYIVDLIKQRKARMRMMKLDSSTSLIKKKIDIFSTQEYQDAAQVQRSQGHGILATGKVVADEELDSLLKSVGASSLDELLEASTGKKSREIKDSIFQRKGTGADPYSKILTHRVTRARDENEVPPFYSEDEEIGTLNSDDEVKARELGEDFESYGNTGQVAAAVGSDDLEDIEGESSTEDAESSKNLEDDSNEPVENEEEEEGDYNFWGEGEEEITSQDLLGILVPDSQTKNTTDMWGNQIEPKTLDEPSDSDEELETQLDKEDTLITDTEYSEDVMSSSEASEDLSTRPLSMSILSRQQRKAVEAHLENQDRLSTKRHLKDIKTKLLNANPLKRVSKEGLLDLKMLNFKEKAPSLESVMQEVDKIITTSDEKLKKAVDRDNKQGNWHFKPRYLDLDQTFDRNASHKADEDLEIYPNIFNLSPRVDPDRKISIEDQIAGYDSMKYDIQSTQTTAVEAYSAMRSDEGYTHYISNHLKYWRDALSRETHERNDPRVKAGFKFVSWEQLESKQVKSTAITAEKQRLDVKGRAHTSGKRKTAVALAWLWPGTGKVTVNKKSLIDYFELVEHRDRVIFPFKLTGTAAEFDLKLTCFGGGISGQAQAAQLAVSRAMVKYLPETTDKFVTRGMLKRDPRMVERKKTSKYKARKSYTFVKR